MSHTGGSLCDEEEGPHLPAGMVRGWVIFRWDGRGVGWRRRGMSGSFCSFFNFLAGAIGHAEI